MGDDSRIEVVSYFIMQHVSDLSNQRVQLGSGTLYGAINTLLEKAWIESVDSIDGGRKKEYLITSMGRSVLHQEIDRLDELIQNGKQLLGGN